MQRSLSLTFLFSFSPPNWFDVDKFDNCNAEAKRCFGSSDHHVNAVPISETCYASWCRWHTLPLAFTQKSSPFSSLISITSFRLTIVDCQQTVGRFHAKKSLRNALMTLDSLIKPENVSPIGLFTSNAIFEKTTNTKLQTERARLRNVRTPSLGWLKIHLILLDFVSLHLHKTTLLDYWFFRFPTSGRWKSGFDLFILSRVEEPRDESSSCNKSLMKQLKWSRRQPRPGVPVEP